MVRAFLATIAAAASLLTMPIASAQTGNLACGSTPSLESASRQASAVFVGTARDIDPTSNRVTFDVSWQWKGAVMPTVVDVEVSPADDLATSAASRLFTAGRNYLVFTQNAFEPFVVDSCAPIQPYVSSASLIPPNLWVALDNETAYRPAAVVAAEPSAARAITTRVLIGVVASIVLILGIRKMVLWQRRRRTDPKPYRMSRFNRQYLESQSKVEGTKRTFGDKALERQRRFFRRRRKRRSRSVAKTASRSKVGAE